MIKREYSKLQTFINTFNEKELSINIKNAILTKLQETFSHLEQSFNEREKFLTNNLVANDHEKKHQIFGFFLNSCGKCLKNFSPKKMEDSIISSEFFCDLCFKKESFNEFYLECSGCKFKVCTLCACNLVDEKEFPCYQCGDELKNKVINNFNNEICYICFEQRQNMMCCDKCNFFVCNICKEIVLMKIFHRSSTNKLKPAEKKKIETFVKEKISAHDIRDLVKIVSKLEDYIMNSKILNEVYKKYDLSSIKTFLKDQAFQFSTFSSEYEIPMKFENGNSMNKEIFSSNNGNNDSFNRRTFSQIARVLEGFEKKHVTFDEKDNYNEGKTVEANRKMVLDEKTIASASFSSISAIKYKEQTPSNMIDKTVSSEAFSSINKKSYNSFNLANETIKSQDISQYMDYKSRYSSRQEKTIASSFHSWQTPNVGGNSFDANDFPLQGTIQSFLLKSANEEECFSFGQESNSDKTTNVKFLFEQKPGLTQSIVEALYDFENNFESLCGENDFDEINKKTLDFFHKLDQRAFEKIFQPDLFDENLYTHKETSAICQELIGAGGYGSVYDFIIKDSSKNEEQIVVGKTFLVKQTNKNEFFFCFNSFLREWKVLRSFDCENIIKSLGVFYRVDVNDELKAVGIFLEKINFELRDYLKEMKNMLSFTDIIELALQICRGVQYIHKQNRIHRDIKLSNILFDSEQNKVKIIDFGTISENIKKNELIMDDAFTLSYAPPEFIRYYYLNEIVPLNFGSDIWSLGVTLFEIFAKKEGVLEFSWLKFISDFELRKIDLDELISLLKKSIIFEEKENELNIFIKQYLEEHISNQTLNKILLRCFSMKPSERIQINELINELNNLLQGSTNDEEKTEKVKRGSLRKKQTFIVLEEHKQKPHRDFEEKESKQKSLSYQQRKEILNNAVRRKNKF